MNTPTRHIRAARRGKQLNLEYHKLGFGDRNDNVTSSIDAMIDLAHYIINQEGTDIDTILDRVRLYATDELLRGNEP